jgi:hypothetical protein
MRSPRHPAAPTRGPGEASREFLTEQTGPDPDDEHTGDWRCLYRTAVILLEEVALLDPDLLEEAMTDIREGEPAMNLEVAKAPADVLRRPNVAH